MKFKPLRNNQFPKELLGSSFYLSRSKSRSHSRPQNLNKSLEKSANKDKPQTAQKERRNFPLIHENIGKFPPYLADGFFIEKALQKKFINKNSQSFIKNDERKSSKIPLKINNYGLLEIKLEKNDKKLENEKKNSEFLSKKTENEKENADFSGRKREKTQSQKEEIAKTEKILSRTEENIEKVRRKSDKKSSKNEENNEKDYQNMMIEEQQNNAMKTPIEQKNEKKTEDGIYEKNVSEKIPSLNHIEKPESNASKSRSYNNISENTNDTINEKTRSFNNSNEKTCGNDEKIQKTPKNDNNATNQKKKNIEKIQEIEKNEEKIEKTEKPIEKVQTITETYVVNFFEEDYNNEEFDKDSEKHYKPSSTPKDVKDVKIDQNPVQQIVHEEIIENSKESSQKKQIKNEISKDNKKIDVITKNNSLNDFSDEGLKRDDSTSGDHQIREISREKPKNRKKKKENSSNISDISDISQKSPPLNEKEAFLVENDSFLQAKSPKKGHKNFISELSSPSVNNSNSPKKMAYEYNVDFDKSSSFSPAGTLNKSLNKSKELSQLSPIGDFSGTSLREPSLNNKNSSKLQPLKEIGKSGDSSQDIHKKLTKLVPIKQSPTLERPITQEGNQRKRPLLTEIPNKKSEHLKYENEKFCSLNIPIKKLVKKVIFN